jgi:hypothetical protein
MSNKHTTDQNQQDSKNVARGLVAIEKAIRKHGETNKAEAPEELRKRDKKHTRIQIAGVLIAAAYAGLTLKLLFATQDQVGLLREQIHTGQRAYVFIEKILLDEPPMLGHDIRFQIEFKNYGGTPARELATRVRIAIAPNESAAVAVRDTGRVVGSTPIASGQTRHIFSTNVPGATTVINQQMMDALNSGEPLFITGVMTYSDVFGGKGETDFCWLSQPKDRPGLTLGLCDHNNDVK